MEGIYAVSTLPAGEPLDIVSPAGALPENLHSARGRPHDLLRRLLAAEARLIDELQRVSLPLLRGAIGIVFIWFGALKVANATPVADFVAKTLPWFDRGWLI